MCNSELYQHWSFSQVFINTFEYMCNNIIRKRKDQNSSSCLFTASDTHIITIPMTWDCCHVGPIIDTNHLWWWEGIDFIKLDYCDALWVELLNHPPNQNMMPNENTAHLHFNVFAILWKKVNMTAWYWSYTPKWHHVTHIECQGMQTVRELEGVFFAVFVV